MKDETCWFLKILFQYKKIILLIQNVFKNRINHEYSSMQTLLTLKSIYFLDNQNPGGRESTLFH